VWETATGTVRVVDLMPPRGRRPDVVRVVEGLSGTVSMRTELVVRFDYGHVVPWVRRREGGWTAVAGPDGLWLDTPVDAVHALRDTERFWRDWIGQCSYEGGYREAVHR
jgi:hypothetical protein